MGNGKVIRWRVSWVRMDGECWGNGFTLGRRLCLEFLNIIKGKHSPIGANRKEDKGVVIRVFQKKTFLKLSFALLTTHAIGL